jgi:protein-disulfide isomerase
MRTILLAVALATAAVPAHAQKPANPDANTPAVTTPSTPKNPNAPVEGANSFTEGQARARIEKEGFTNVTDLTKDAKGVWRGTATKGGKKAKVSVDFQGNVTAN